MFTASHSPSSRLPTLRPVVQRSPSGPSSPLDISPHQNTSLHQYDNNVVRELSLPPASAYPSATILPRSSRNNASLLHPLAHFLTSPHHVSIDSFTPRPRTPPVPVTQRSLFAQHGLPSSLPPPPRTTFYTQQGLSHLFLAKDQESEVSNIASIFDTILRNSYSQMLSQKPESNVPDSVAEAQLSAPAALELTLDDMFKPDYLDPTNHDEYLTSPLLQDDTPEETPFLETPGEDAWTSPIIDECDDSFGVSSMPLFGAVVRSPDVKAPTPDHESLEGFGHLQLYTSSLDKVDPATPLLSALDIDVTTSPLYTMPSTPAVQPATLHNVDTLTNPPQSSSTPARLTKPLPTGTRRNITPAALVPLDAPTQPRQYVTPSATSRKPVPAAFRGKKRGVGEFDEGVVDEDAIEAKRRQNTLAARRSRQRKLQHVRELEETLGHVTADRDEWMKRAYEAEAKLRAHGIS